MSKEKCPECGSETGKQVERPIGKPDRTMAFCKDEFDKGCRWEEEIKE